MKNSHIALDAEQRIIVLKTVYTRRKNQNVSGVINLAIFSRSVLNLKKTDLVKNSVNVVKANDSRMVPVINRHRINALLDTGSDVNIIQEDVGKQLGISNLQRTTRVFTSLGNKITKPVGKFFGCLSIGQYKFNDDIFVVPTEAMTSELILGQTLLDKAEVLKKQNYNKKYI